MPPASPPSRIHAIDWLRGLSVLVMIQCHALCLVLPALLQGRGFALLSWLDGLVAPAFFFCAGFALALVQVRAAAAGQRAARALQSARRMGEVLAVSALMTSFWFPILSEPRWLLRIDVLSCIGVSLLLALGPVALLAGRPRLLAGLALLASAAIFGLAPWLAQVQGPLAPLLGVSTGSVFPPVPWAGHVALGIAAGALAAGEPERFGRRLLELAGLGLGLYLLALLLSAQLPPHDPWTEPASHLERWIEVCLAGWLLLRLEQREVSRATGPLRWTIEFLGQSSLSAYFAHETWLYTTRLGFSFNDAYGKRLDWLPYAAQVALLIGLTLAFCFALDRLQALARLLVAAARTHLLRVSGLPAQVGATTSRSV